MLNENTQELLNRAIDRELSASDRQKFEQLTGEDAGLRRQYDDLTRMVGLLETCPDLDVPVDFSSSVRDKLARPARNTWGNKRFVWAMAASVLLAAGIVSLNLDSGKKSDLVGTMAENNSLLSKFIHLERGADWVLVIDVPGEFRLEVQGIRVATTGIADTGGNVRIRNLPDRVVIQGSGSVDVRIPLIPGSKEMAGSDWTGPVVTLHLGDRLLKGTVSVVEKGGFTDWKNIR